MQGLRKAFIKHALEGELTDLLGYAKHHPAGRGSGNSRNGFSRQAVQTDGSEIEVNSPRERNAAFDPKLIAKQQKRWDGFAQTLRALYARGLSTRDMQSFLPEKYARPVSPEFISSVCESLSEGVPQGRPRALTNVWPTLYLEALLLKVRDQGKVESLAW